MFNIVTLLYCFPQPLLHCYIVTRVKDLITGDLGVKSKKDFPAITIHSCGWKEFAHDPLVRSGIAAEVGNDRNFFSIENALGVCENFMHG